MTNKLLSICIPTFNRSKHLENLLKSLVASNIDCELVEVCVSDNCSTDETKRLINRFSDNFPIIYSCNEKNVGMSNNILEVVGMAKSKYVWILGDDDLVICHNFNKLLDLLKLHPNVDFFYLNSIHCISTQESNNLMFNPHEAEKNKLFSKQTNSGQLKFKDLIQPSYSFDFLGGIYLSVFTHQLWKDGISVIDKAKLNNGVHFSTLENTFPHVKIFANSFMNSMAYFSSLPFTINSSEARDWSILYPAVRVLRMNDALDEYRKNGLSFWRFLICRNSTLKNFFKDYKYLSNDLNYKSEVDGLFFYKKIIYPFAFLSIFRFFIEKILGRSLKSIFNKSK